MKLKRVLGVAVMMVMVFTFLTFWHLRQTLIYVVDVHSCTYMQNDICILLKNRTSTCIHKMTNMYSVVKD